MTDLSTPAESPNGGYATVAPTANICGERVDDTATDARTTALAKLPMAFRHNSLALAAYPWDTGIVMVKDLSRTFDESHYAFVSVTLLVPLSSNVNFRSVLLDRPAGFRCEAIHDVTDHRSSADIHARCAVRSLFEDGRGTNHSRRRAGPPKISEACIRSL